MSDATATITIPVDPDLAGRYAQTTPEERQKIQLMLRFILQDLMVPEQRSLAQVMDAIGAEAQRRGLTPAILDELLRDDS